MIKTERFNKLNLLLWELSVGGHYPEYISHIVRYWCEYKISGFLTVIIVPEFLERHFDVVAIPEQYKTKNVKFLPIKSEEQNKLHSYSSGINRPIRGLQEFNLLSTYAEKLKINNILFPYFDTRMLSLALGKKLPCSFSGVYFRPSFHYAYFKSGYVPSWKDKLQNARERVTLSRVINNNNLKTLFCLDSFAVKHINQASKQKKAIYLPDPVRRYPSSSHWKLDKIRTTLNIEKDRQVHLVFGDLNKRKGVKQILEAASLIPKNLLNKFCLLFVGSMSGQSYEQFQTKKRELQKLCSIQIIHQNQYIPETSIQSYFELSDVILALYQRHVGMSGILNRAAAARKPVLSSDYGLMGEITRHYQLGLTVDSSKPQSIAKFLSKFLEGNPQKYCDPDGMFAFAEQNSVDKFTSIIFGHL